MYSQDIKSIAIKLYNKYKNYRYVANLLDIGKSTIHRWYNNIIYKTKSFYKLNLCLLIDIINLYIKNNNFFKLIDIKKYLFNNYNITISISLIYNILKKKIKLSYKKVSNNYYYKDINELNKKKEEFKKKVIKYNKNNIISIDETYFYNNDNLNYGWSLKGQKIYHNKYSHRIKYSMIMAISNKKIIYYEIHKTSINTDLFYNFITNLKYLINKKDILLMDNVSFHRSKKILDLLNNNVLFIPPYSPEFNPIEFIFSLIKKQYKYLNTYNNTDFYNNIIKSINSIKKQSYFINIYNNSLS